MPPLPKPVICVFAGSSTPSDRSILHTADIIGARIGAEGYDLVYGGGTNGTMGAVARAAQNAGSAVYAITPELYKDEPQIPNTAVTIVKNEAERFEAFTTFPNLVAYVTLPGGPGALREAMQGLEKAVYENGPPVLLADETSDYLSGIEHYFKKALSAGLIKPDKAGCLQKWMPCYTFAQLILHAQNPAGWTYAPGFEMK